MGVLTALLGSPFFFWLLRRTRRRHGGGRRGRVSSAAPGAQFPAPLGRASASPVAQRPPARVLCRVRPRRRGVPAPLRVSVPSPPVPEGPSMRLLRPRPAPPPPASPATPSPRPRVFTSGSVRGTFSRAWTSPSGRVKCSRWSGPTGPGSPPCSAPWPPTSRPRPVSYGSTGVPRRTGPPRTCSASCGVAAVVRAELSLLGGGGRTDGTGALGRARPGGRRGRRRRGDAADRGDRVRGAPVLRAERRRTRPGGAGPGARPARAAADARRADGRARPAPPGAGAGAVPGAGTGGDAVVVVLHDLGLAAAYAHRVAVLRAGRVAADGPRRRSSRSPSCRRSTTCPWKCVRIRGRVRFSSLPAGVFDSPVDCP